MRLVDTSAWIEWLALTPAGRAVEVLLPERDDWLVPTIVQLELMKWATRELGEDKADQIIAFSEMCVLAPLDTKIALAAAELGARHRLPMADAIVYATAIERGADVLTCDRHFDGLPGVSYVAKVGP